MRAMECVYESTAAAPTVWRYGLINLCMLKQSVTSLRRASVFLKNAVECLNYSDVSLDTRTHCIRTQYSHTDTPVELRVDLVIGLDFWCFLFLLLSNFVLARPTKQNSPHILYGHKWAYSELDDIRTYRKIHMQNNIRYDMAMGADDNSRKQKQNTSNLWRPTTTKYKHLSAKHKVQQWLSFI